MIIQPENDAELDEINYLKSAMIQLLQLCIARCKHTVSSKQVDEDIDFLKEEIGVKFAKLFNPELWEEFENEITKMAKSMAIVKSTC